MELISVIVPVYKVEKYLKKCVDSIRNQTYQNLEILLVDDGSPDECPAMCDAYADEDSRIKVIHKENGGLSDARNVGVEMANGEWIFFLDSDDYIHTELIDTLHKEAIKENADMAMSSMYYYLEDATVQIDPLGTSEKEVFLKPDVVSQLYSHSAVDFIVSCSKLIKRDVWGDLQFPVGKLHEDEFIAAELLDCLRCCVFIKVRWYFYLQRNDSITGLKSKKNYYDILEAKTNRVHYFKEREYEELFAKAVKDLKHDYMSLYVNLDDKLFDAYELRQIKNNFREIPKTKHSCIEVKKTDGFYSKIFGISPRLYRKVVVVRKKLYDWTGL